MELNVKLSKFLSLVLRHQPEKIGLKLDKNGWADVNELIEKISLAGNKIDTVILNKIVETDSKGRYSFNEDNTKIRANQGHSIDVDVELKECIPPKILYHGTAKKFHKSIMSTGVEKRGRNYVHLSDNKETALNVGKRHGEPLVLYVDSKRMYEDGIKFFISENGVWLTDRVEPRYIIED